jgi:hypothetical protein
MPNRIREYEQRGPQDRGAPSAGLRFQVPEPQLLD